MVFKDRYINSTVSEISDIITDFIEMNYEQKYLSQIGNVVTVSYKMMNFTFDRSDVVT